MDTVNNQLHNLDALRDVTLFVAVAEARSFAIAARKLGVPPSTLSWRISALEKALQVQLFHRTTRRVELTTTGWMHFDRCRQLVREAQLLTEDMRAHSLAPRGRLRLSTTTDFAICVLSPVLAEFTNQYPDITIDLDTSANRVDLLADNLDIAIRFGPLPDSDLIARLLMEAHLNLYASPGYLFARGTPVRPADLRDHHCVKTGPAPGEFIWRLLRGSEQAVIRSTARVWSNQMTLTRALLLNGLGIGMLVEEHYADDIRIGRLVRVLPDWHFAASAVSIVVPQRQIPAKTQVLVEFLISALKPRNNDQSP